MFKKLLCVPVMLFATATAWAAVDVNKADQATLDGVWLQQDERSI